jgi:YD repeat-containing protein
MGGTRCGCAQALRQPLHRATRMFGRTLVRVGRQRLREFQSLLVRPLIRERDQRRAAGLFLQAFGQNRLSTAKVGDAQTSYDYFPDGRLAHMDRGNGTHAIFEYFETRRIKTIRQQFAGGIEASTSYTFDKNGNPTSKTDARDGETEVTNYDQYDAADRLTQFHIGHQTTKYTYERYHRKTEQVALATRHRSRRSLVQFDREREARRRRSKQVPACRDNGCSAR